MRWIATFMSISATSIRFYVKRAWCHEQNYFQDPFVSHTEYSITCCTWLHRKEVANVCSRHCAPDPEHQKVSMETANTQIDVVGTGLLNHAKVQYLVRLSV